ncbi:MAG: GNAT family N-acetyltransferase [Clostridia bacterium]|nr:GNAT family N-acetyltransferase [Clostridia bacterium]
MKTTFRIEQVTEKNYPLFEDMVSRREHGYGYMSMGGTEKQIRKELKNPNLCIYAMEIEGRYVGWISLVYTPKVGKWKHGGHVYVDELWLEPRLRGYGLGKKLMERAEHFRKKCGAVGIRLYVNTQNEEALGLCETLGFGEGGTAVFYEKEAARPGPTLWQRFVSDLRKKPEKPPKEARKMQKKALKEQKKVLKQQKKFKKAAKKAANARLLQKILH